MNFWHSLKKKLKGNMPDIYLLFLLGKLYKQKFVYGNTITKLEVEGFQTVGMGYNIRNYTVIITNSLTDFSTGNVSFPGLFLSSITDNTCFWSWPLNDGCFIKNSDYLSFVSTWVLYRVYGGVHIGHLLSLLCCYFFFLSIRSLSCSHCCLCFWIFHSWLSFRTKGFRTCRSDIDINLEKAWPRVHDILCLKYNDDIYI